jgi:hypothetical protein
MIIQWRIETCRVTYEVIQVLLSNIIGVLSMVKLILYINVLYGILLPVEENETLGNVQKKFFFLIPLTSQRPERDLKFRMVWLLCFFIQAHYDLFLLFNAKTFIYNNLLTRITPRLRLSNNNANTRVL